MDENDVAEHKSIPTMILCDLRSIVAFDMFQSPLLVGEYTEYSTIHADERLMNS